MSGRAGGRGSVRALGPIGVWAGDRPVPIGGAKPRRLLAAFVIHRNSVVRTERLMEVVWGDDLPETATATLQAYVSRLRRALPDGLELVSEAPGYRFVVPPGSSDVDRFEAGFEAGAAAEGPDPARALELLDGALAEWDGEAFAEFATEPWALPAAMRLTELRLQALEARVRARAALGLHEQVIGEAQALTAEEPWREPAWRVLAEALHRVGRQGDALRAISTYRARLRDERGLDPSAEIVDLEQRILADDLGGGAGAAGRPTGAVADALPARVPVAPVELIGRDRDAVRVDEQCREHRLVTLVGPGGIGKTQLARRVASDIATRQAVTPVELAPVRDELSVVGAIATHLGVQVQQGRSVLDSVVDLLSVRAEPLLLALDNCEHVLDAVAAFVERLLAVCPAVRVLATSREPLGLPHERVYQVPALPVPDAGADPDHCRDAPAVALFLRRAAASSERTFDDAAVQVVADLCRRLDGIPLAIELAAARTRALSPTEIAERLDDRFGLLTGTSRVADERHRSLRTLVDWSYGLLDPSEQELFRRLAIFAGSFDLDAAERVCGDRELPPGSVATVLASLVDKSMVQATAGPRTSYRLLETLRDYGAALGSAEAPDLVHRHVTWLVDVCEQGAIGVLGEHERQWLDTFDGVFDDLRLGVRNALAAGDAGTAMRLVVAAREHAFRRLRYELIGWAEAALASPGADDEPAPLRAATLGVVAYGRFVRGEGDAAIELATAAQELAEGSGADTLGLPERTLGNAHFFRGDRAVTVMATEALLAGALASGDDARIAHAHYMRSLGETRSATSNLGMEAAELAAEAAVRSGNPTALAQAAYAIGIWSTATDPTRARRELARSEALAHEVGNRWFELFARTETLWLQALDGEPEEALAGFADVLSAWHRAGDWANQWLSVRHVFGICTQVGADELAMVIHGALERAGAVDAFPFEPAAAAQLEQTVDALRRRLGDRVTALELRGRNASTSAVISLIVDGIRELAER